MKLTYDYEVNQLENSIKNRSNHLINYLNHISVNADYASQEIIKCIEKKELFNNEQIQDTCMPLLLNIVESSNTSGVFIIFNNNEEITGRKEAIYLRDTEPDIIQYNYEDVQYLSGINSLARKYNIQIISKWKEYMWIDKSYSFYMNPIEAFRKLYPLDGNNDRNFSYSTEAGCGYWSSDFQFPNMGMRSITYTLPLIGSQGSCYGILGFEVSYELLKNYIPISEPPFHDAIFLVGKKGKEKKDERNKDTYQCVFYHTDTDEIIDRNTPISLVRKLKKNANIYEVNLEDNKWIGLYEKLSLYRPDDYYTNDSWALIGMVNEHNFNHIGIDIFILFISAIGIITLISGLCILYVYRRNKKKLIELQLSTNCKDSYGEIFQEFISNINLLTYTEKLIFHYYLEGKSASDVAEHMNISINTVKVHNKHIYTKLNITSKDELSLYVNLLKKAGKLSLIK
jgi:DNA-binding CsgD family transcriptional regulator